MQARAERCISFIWHGWSGGELACQEHLIIHLLRLCHDSAEAHPRENEHIVCLRTALPAFSHLETFILCKDPQQ